QDAVALGVAFFAAITITVLGTQPGEQTAPVDADGVRRALLVGAAALVRHDAVGYPIVVRVARAARTHQANFQVTVTQASRFVQRAKIQIRGACRVQPDEVQLYPALHVTMLITRRRYRIDIFPGLGIRLVGRDHGHGELAGLLVPSPQIANAAVAVDGEHVFVATGRCVAREPRVDLGGFRAAAGVRVAVDVDEYETADVASRRTGVGYVQTKVKLCVGRRRIGRANVDRTLLLHECPEPIASHILAAMEPSLLTGGVHGHHLPKVR